MLKLPENPDLRLERDRNSINRFKRFSERMGLIIAENKPYHPLSDSENVIDARDRFAERAVPGFQCKQNIGQIAHQPSHVYVHDNKPSTETASDLGA
jgi:hypothetical protein